MPGPETVLAFDYGLRRIGVAVGQAVTGSATALATLDNGPDGADWAGIAKLVGEWRPQRLIVGMPLRADGSPGDIAASVERFCAELARFHLPVDTVDERHSSQEAAAHLKAARQRGSRRRISRGEVDAAAAAMIAERWLARATLGPQSGSE